MRVRAARTRRLNFARAQAEDIRRGHASPAVEVWLLRARRHLRKGLLDESVASLLDTELPGWRDRTVRQLHAEGAGQAPLRLRGEAFVDGFVVAVRAGTANVNHARFLADQKRSPAVAPKVAVAMTSLSPNWRDLTLSGLMAASGAPPPPRRRRSTVVDRITRMATGAPESSDRRWLAEQKDAAALGRQAPDVALMLAALDPDWREHTLGQIIAVATGGAVRARGSHWERAERGALAESVDSSLNWLRRHRRAHADGTLDAFTRARLDATLPGWLTLTPQQLDARRADEAQRLEAVA